MILQEPARTKNSTGLCWELASSKWLVASDSIILATNHLPLANHTNLQNHFIRNHNLHLLFFYSFLYRNMKKTLIILFCSSLAVACGNSGNSTETEKKDSSTTTAPAPAAADSKGLELIGASDCTTCHRLDQASPGVSTGPAYSEVAAKYAPAADTTVSRLVEKIIKGGSGVWGQVPMTPHPALAEADVREMVKYILSIKK